MEDNMRKLILPLTLALIAAAPGAAFAASTAAAPAPRPAASSQADQIVSGTVKAFDLKAHTLTLADGKTYQLPANFKDPGLKMGEKITVHWKMDGAKYDATSVTLG
jgi:Cu/Ag efflux protein CusF